MGLKGERSTRLPLSAPRILAMAVAIGCHLFLLMALLLPAAPSTDMLPNRKDDEAALNVQFISPPRPTSAPPALPGFPPVALPGAPAKDGVPLRAQSAVHAATRAHNADAISDSPLTVVPDLSAAIDRDTNNSSPMGDGGFRDRMSNAQHAPGIRGVPGSDRRVVPGIELTNPMNQGVGSVMGNAQRLFGVTNRHCIDVDVWRHLSPDELKDRHLTLADVETESEKYNCNRPLGLYF